MMEELKKVVISDEQIDKIIKDGPEKCFEIFKEYAQDVHTLAERMQDLYDAEPILAVLGVKVKVEVSMDNMKAVDIEFGCDGIKEEEGVKDEL